MKPSTLVYTVITLQMAIAVFLHPEKVQVGAEGGAAYTAGFQLGEVGAAALIWFIVIIIPAFIYRVIRKKAAGKQPASAQPVIRKPARAPQEAPIWLRQYQKALMICFLVSAVYCLFSPVVLENSHWPKVISFYTFGLTVLFGLIVAIVFSIVYGIKAFRARK